MDDVSDTTLYSGLLNQHWEQARHEVKLMYQFTSIYAVILTGSLAVLIESWSGISVYLAGFVFFLSLVGLILGMKSGLEYLQHMKYVEKMVKRSDVEPWASTSLGLYSGIDDYETSELMSPHHWLLTVYLLGLSVSGLWLVFHAFEAIFSISIGIWIRSVVTVLVFVCLIVGVEQTGNDCKKQMLDGTFVPNPGLDNEND